MTYSNALQISWSGRSAGDNALADIKGSLDRIAAVPALRQDKALRDLVILLNLPQSAFTTLACASEAEAGAAGHRVSGYVEFAFYPGEASADPSDYFGLFLHFDRALHGTAFDHSVHFLWELAGSAATDAPGFTMTVAIDTGLYPTSSEAAAAWQNGLDFLANALVGAPMKT